jgi:integrase/recombinase XerD
LALAVVRDLREQRALAGLEELAEFETDVLAACARPSSGRVGGLDATIRGDVGHLEQVRTWLGKPLWEMEPADADIYFGKVVRHSAKGTRLARAQALTRYFAFLSIDRTMGRHADAVEASLAR